uniref:Amino acid transporter n=1 Tax=Macrostomum lignano TaxID=282301 RepID=A0A1I8FAT6_9PLAT
IVDKAGKTDRVPSLIFALVQNSNRERKHSPSLAKHSRIMSSAFVYIKDAILQRISSRRQVARLLPPGALLGDCCRTFLRRNVFVLCLILGVAAGIGLAHRPSLRQAGLDGQRAGLLQIPRRAAAQDAADGDPAAGHHLHDFRMSSLGRNASSWIGLRAVVYYMCTTLFAVIIGIVLVRQHPPGPRSRELGDNAATGLLQDRECGRLAAGSHPHSMKFIIPGRGPQPLRRRLTECHGQQLDRFSTLTTTNIATTVADSLNASSGPTPKPTLPRWSGWRAGNLLGIIVFSLAFGVALSRIGERGHVARQFFDGCSEAVLVVVQSCDLVHPIGIIFLISGKIIEMENVVETLSQLGLYSITVISGLVIHGFIVLPLIYLIVVRRNPFRYMFGSLRAILTALSTASSSATPAGQPVLHLEEVNGRQQDGVRFRAPGRCHHQHGRHRPVRGRWPSVFIAQPPQLLWAPPVVPEAGLVTMVIRPDRRRRCPRMTSPSSWPRDWFL